MSKKRNNNNHAMQELLSPFVVKHLGDIFRQTFPDGPRGNGSPEGNTREMGVNVVNCTSFVLKRNDSKVRLAVEWYKGKSGHRIVGLVVFNGENQRTTIVPMTTSPGVVRLNGEAVWVAHPEGATNLFHVILREAKKALEEDIEKSLEVSE